MRDGGGKKKGETHSRILHDGREWRYSRPWQRAGVAGLTAHVRLLPGAGILGESSYLHRAAGARCWPGSLQALCSSEQTLVPRRESGLTYS